MDLPKGKTIKNHWVFDIKSDSYYRSQLVAKGFSQVERINFDELFPSVVCYETVCLFLAVAILEDWDIHSVNVKTTYLYGDLDKEIYIESSLKVLGYLAKKKTLVTPQSIIWP